MQQSIYQIINVNRGMFSFHENALSYFGVAYLLHRKANVSNDIIEYLKGIVISKGDFESRKRIVKECAEKYGHPFACSLLYSIAKGFLAISNKDKDNFVTLIDRFVESFNCIDLTDDTVYKECVESFIDIYNNPAGHNFWSNQPIEVTKLVSFLLRSYEKECIYNPFSGLSSYALDSDTIEYLGQEINSDVADIARIRLDANGKETNVIKFDIDETDSTLMSGNEIDDLLKYTKIDCMVATPPFGLKCSLPSNSPNYYKCIEEKVIKNFLDSECLDTAILVFALKSTSDRRLKGIRQRLIKEDLLDLVIELPKKIFPGTAIGTTIWVLSKNRADIGRDHVTMIDARNLMVDGKLDYKTISNVFNEFNSDEELDALTNLLPYLIGVSKEDIEGNDYSFTPSIYFEKVIVSNNIPEGFEVQKLSKFLKPINHSNHSPAPARKISVKDLSKTPYSCIDLEKLEDYPLQPGSTVHNLDRDLLLTASLGDELKASLYKHNPNIRVALHNYIDAYELIDNSITYEYIISEMWKDYMRRQFVALKPSSHSYTSYDAFLSMEIYVPIANNEYETKMRDRIIDARDEFNRSQIERLGLELEHLKDIRHNEYTRNIRMRKHAISQILNELCPSIDMMINFIKRNDGKMCDSDVISVRSGMTAGEYMGFFRSNLYKLSAMVDKLADDYTEESKGSLEIIPFLREHLDNYTCGTVHFGFQLNIDKEITESLEGEELSSIAVTISDKSLSKVLKNIFVNAVKHGFTDIQRDDYCILIEVGQCKMPNMEDGLCLTISNNGNPLQEGIAADKIYTWGVSSDGTGIGGYEIKGIIEANGGIVDFDSTPNDPNGFYVKYIIKLPINNE